MTTAITGATGLLGLRLLTELVEREDRIIVLARPGPVTVLERVAAFLRARGDSDELLRTLPERVRVFDADITKRGLGMDPAALDTLTREVSGLWHNAASIGLRAVDPQTRRTNVVGTRNVLELADRCPKLRALRHSSTHVVAGAREHGVIGDDELDDSHGFNNDYERSKFDAEVRVRRWAGEDADRDVLVFRPALLTSDLGPYPGEPAQPLVVARDTTAALADRFPEFRSGLVVPGDGTAPVSVLPVEHAARAMADASVKAAGPGLRTINVTAEHVPTHWILDAVAERVGFSVCYSDADRPIPDSHIMAGSLDVASGVAPMGTMTRTFADTALTELGLACPREPPVDCDYLRSCLR